MSVFENPGEIDIRSISTFGVSVKEGDNPIGFFGTGLKYAIAVLLRTGHRVTIMSGLSVVQFAVAKTTVRGQEFDFVTMAIDGAEPAAIGFTTELGKQWDVWMAYREIACNSKDEKGEGCLGLAEDQTIYIAERVFHLGGTKQLASTLIEEYLHLRHGWKDLTRELQSFLFDKLVSLGEELVGEPL